MLQTFRAVINSVIGKIFFIILLVTFGLLGVGYGFRDLVLDATSSNDAATVGSTTVSMAQLDRVYRQQLANYQRQLGPSFSPTTAQKQQLAGALLNQQVTNALYSETAAADGLRVSDAMLRAVIAAEPAFAGDDKRFDPAHFRAQLEAQGLSEAVFIPQVRSSIARQLLINPVAETAVPPKFLLEDIYRYRNEQRVAQTILIPDSAVTNVPAPTDAEIADYYQKHAVEFTAPEYRSFTVLSLTPDLFMGDVKPTDEEVRAAYDARKADYVVPEKRKIDQVLVSDEATAQAIAKAAQPGKSLADAAKAATAGKVQPISLDLLTKDEYPEALREPVFTAAKDVTVGPVQSPLGWHVIQVKDILPGHEVPFDDVKAKLTEEVRHDGAADRLAEQIDKLGDKLSGGAAIEAVAAGVNATPVKFGPVDAKGGDASSNLPAPAKADVAKPDPAWTAAAFQLQSGETSPFQDGKDGAYFAVRLDGITPPALHPLAEVRAAVVKNWTVEKRAALTDKIAEDLAAKARAGTAMTQIAADAKSKMETTVAFTRDPATAKIANAPQQPVVDAMFQATKVGDIVTVATDDGRVIARLTEIRPADPLAAGVDLGPINQELSTALQKDQLAQFVAGLRQNTKVKINPRAVETVTGQ
jgi:peptidyl-prolyl cis-trans isomerase D